MVILTGGEPLLREDIFELAAYGHDLGHRMVMAVNGTLLTPEVATRLKDAGIQRLSISIDGATAASHDRLRAVDGAYEGALGGIAACNEAGLPFQINTTVTRADRLELPAIHELAPKLGAAAHHVFVLVPTGRGDLIREELVSPAEYEETLKWLLARQQDGRLFIKPTCAPQYYRLWRQDAHARGEAIAAASPWDGGHDQGLWQARASPLSPTGGKSSPAATWSWWRGTSERPRSRKFGPPPSCSGNCAGWTTTAASAAPANTARSAGAAGPGPMP